MMRTIAMLGLTLFSTLSLGCAKHECSFDSDEEKKAFGELADMTAGASRCDVKGTRVAAGMLMPYTMCDVGDDDCVATMDTFHGDVEQEKVAADYKAFLETKGWKVKQKPYESKRQNGKPLKGIKLRAAKGDDVLLVTMYMLADKLVEVSTLRVDKDMVKPDEDEKEARR